MPRAVAWGVVAVLLGQAVLCTASTPACDHSASDRLEEGIFSCYDTSVKPPMPPGRAIKVHIMIEVTAVHYFENDGVLNVRSYVFLRWRDERLMWNTTGHEPETLLVNTDSVWTPDIYLLNAASESGHGPQRLSRCRLRSSGDLFCSYAGRFSALCPGDLRSWPWDLQTCRLQLGSLRLSARDLVFSVSEMVDYTDSSSSKPAWAVTNMAAHLDTYRSSRCANDSHSLAVIELSIQRQPAQHLALVSGPIVVLYLRDSLLMALASLVVAVVARRCSLNTSAPPGLLVAAVVRARALLQLRAPAPLSFKIAHTRLSGHQDIDDQDSCELVETPARPLAVSWGQVVRLVDLLLLAVFAALHLVFLLALLA
ncbi:acetylcholine receptor subunit beta-like isoform X3 [Bacillus rossius redtenbacheri]|uniref:acetylcholine receptor subunit beta-like isoform X3 n=1 Tax=Bacillus rossius redtenbacheri TaxID=93214 RepID=UPI002FDEDD1B